MSKIFNEEAQPKELLEATIHVRTTKEKKELLSLEANRRGLKISQLVKIAIDYYLENN